MARVYRHTADACRALADQKPAHRQAHLSDAVAFLKRSLLFWEELEHEGLLTSADAPQPLAVREMIVEGELP